LDFGTAPGLDGEYPATGLSEERLQSGASAHRWREFPRCLVVRKSGHHLDVAEVQNTVKVRLQRKNNSVFFFFFFFFFRVPRFAAQLPWKRQSFSSLFSFSFLHFALFFLERTLQAALSSQIPFLFVFSPFQWTMI
jgi:hypothetical protein